MLEVGFGESLDVGDTVLPSNLGSITKYNAEGKYIKHKDRPKETAFRQQEWTWTEFRGRYDTKEMSRVVDIPYERYPRTFVKPPSIELTVSKCADGTKIIASPSMRLSDTNEDEILHVINIFLEIFGCCELKNKDFESIVKSTVKKLNWNILPQGKRPWSELKPLIRELRESATEGNRKVIDKRFESINIHEPNFVAVGKAGFSGYLVFGFPDKNIYVLESTYTNNATYLLESDWEHISTLTKAEILDKSLHKERLIHRENWFSLLNQLLMKKVA